MFGDVVYMGVHLCIKTATTLFDLKNFKMIYSRLTNSGCLLIGKSSSYTGSQYLSLRVAKDRGSISGFYPITSTFLNGAARSWEDVKDLCCMPDGRSECEAETVSEVESEWRKGIGETRVEELGADFSGPIDPSTGFPVFLPDVWRHAYTRLGVVSVEDCASQYGKERRVIHTLPIAA